MYAKNMVNIMLYHDTIPCLYYGKYVVYHGTEPWYTMNVSVTLYHGTTMEYCTQVLQWVYNGTFL